MVNKKIRISDPNVSIVMELHTDSELTFINPDVRQFTDLIKTLDSVVNGGLKKWEVLNGLPVYDYYMKDKSGREFIETVRIIDGNFDDAKHSFTVPDEWEKKELDVYFQVRRLSTKLLYEHKIVSIKINWN